MIDSLWIAVSIAGLSACVMALEIYSRTRHLNKKSKELNQALDSLLERLDMIPERKREETMGVKPLSPPVAHQVSQAPSYEKQMTRHSFQEARREIDCWWSGKPYAWIPFTPRLDPMEDVETIDCLVILR